MVKTLVSLEEEALAALHAAEARRHTAQENAGAATLDSVRTERFDKAEQQKREFEVQQELRIAGDEFQARQKEWFRIHQETQNATR